MSKYLELVKSQLTNRDELKEAHNAGKHTKTPVFGCFYCEFESGTQERKEELVMELLGLSKLIREVKDYCDRMETEIDSSVKKMAITPKPSERY